MFLRVLNVTIPGFLISGLRIDFDIMQTNREKTKEPDGGDITIYNMSPSSRKILRAAQKQPIFLNAGHLDNLAATVFSGTITGYREENQTTELLSILEVENRGGPIGDVDFETIAISLTFPPGTTASSIIATLASLAGVPLAEVPLKDYVFLDGYSYSGVLKGALDEVVEECLAVNWYVNANKLYVSDPGTLSVGIPQVINASTGMIGSIEAFEEQDPKNKKKVLQKYRFKTLISSRVFVGSTVVIQSRIEGVNATVKIESIHKYGSNWATDYYNEYIGREI